MAIGETIGLIEALKGGSPLPPVTSSDNGKVLGVVDGAWAASEQGKKFIVTLTPTSPDYSGTMDKTVAEINAAYDAGMEIVFKILAGGNRYYDISATMVDKESDDYPAFCGFGLLTERFVQIYTPSTMDGTENTYYTTVYSLTPAS